MSYSGGKIGRILIPPRWPGKARPSHTQTSTVFLCEVRGWDSTQAGLCQPLSSLSCCGIWLNNATLTYADLCRAQLSPLVWPYSVAMLSSANLSHATLNGAGLGCPDLVFANLGYCPQPFRRPLQPDKPARRRPDPCRSELRQPYRGQTCTTPCWKKAIFAAIISNADMSHSDHPRLHLSATSTKRQLLCKL